MPVTVRELNPKPKGRLTEDDLLHTKTRLVNDPNWKKQKAKDQRWHDMYHLEYAVETIEDEETMLVNPMDHIVRTGRAPELVERIAGLMRVYPEYAIMRVGLGSRPASHAEKLEELANQIRPTIEREQGDDTNAMVTLEVPLYGYTVATVTPDPRHWQNKYPKRGDDKVADYLKRLDDFNLTAPIPISIFHASAPTAYPLLAGTKVRKLLQVKKVSAAWVMERYGIDPKVDSETDEVEFVEYLDDAEMGWMVQNGDHFKQMIDIWAHKMPVEPGTAPAVLYEGLTSSDRRPGYRWKSVLETVEDAIKNQDFALTRQRVAIAFAYLLTLIHTVRAQGGESLEEVVAGRKFTLGGMNWKFENEIVEIMQQPGVLPDLEAFYTKWENRLARVFPDVLEGVLPSETSGYLFNLAREAAMTRFSQMSDNMVTADADLMRLVFLAFPAFEEILKGDKIKTHLKRPFSVTIRRRADEGGRARSYTADDVADYGPLLEARRIAQFPVDKLANLQAAQEAYAFGFSKKRAMAEYMNVTDPHQVILERLAEDLELSGPALQKLQNELLALLDIKTSEEEGITREQAMQMDLPPGIRKMLELQPGPAGPEAPPATQGAVQSDVAPVQPTGVGVPEFQNPTAGQKTRPKGPRRKAGSSKRKARSQ